MWVVRVTRPDLRSRLHDSAEIEQCESYRDLADSVLHQLAERETVVLNLGLVEPHPSIFYRYLLKVRDGIREKKAKLIVCSARADVQEMFDLLKASEIFTFVESEERATRSFSETQVIPVISSSAPAPDA